MSLLFCIFEAVNKKVSAALLAVFLAAAFCVPARAQKGSLMRFTVTEAGDTVFYDSIAPSYVFAGRKKGSKWRKYYRLVHNFSKVYPYALYAGELMAETDSTFDANNYGSWKRQKYVDKLQKKLFKAYEKPLRRLSLSQGQLMLRLIDRETGEAPYELIRNYKNKTAAGFWQGVGKLFGADLKKRYDPKGIDRETEELVQIWRRGEFDGFYYSIFGRLPESPDLGLKHKYGAPSIQESRMENSVPEGSTAR